MSLVYCKECGQLIGRGSTTRTWYIGDVVMPKFNARRLTEMAGIEWTDEMSHLVNRKGRVSDITLRYVEVEFVDLKGSSGYLPKVEGKFKFSPHALQHYEGKMLTTARRLRQKSRAIRNYKAYDLAATMARADRAKGWYGNPFKSEKFASLLAMRDKYISPRKIKDVLGIRSITTLWTQISRLQLNKAENDWLVDMMCARYDHVWAQEDEKMRDKYLLALLIQMLDTNSLRLNAKVLRAVKERNFDALKLYGYNKLRAEYGIDIIALDRDPDWHEHLEDDDGELEGDSEEAGPADRGDQGDADGGAGEDAGGSGGR